SEATSVALPHSPRHAIGGVSRSEMLAVKVRSTRSQAPCPRLAPFLIDSARVSLAARFPGQDAPNQQGQASSSNSVASGSSATESAPPPISAWNGPLAENWWFQWSPLFAPGRAGPAETVK